MYAWNPYRNNNTRGLHPHLLRMWSLYSYRGDHHQPHFLSCLMHILTVLTSLAEPIFVGTLYAPTWSMKRNYVEKFFEELLRRLNLINLGEVALGWRQIWGVLFLVINWFPLWLYYSTASGDPAHCSHIYTFLVVNGLNAQVHSCAWNFFYFGTITYFV